MPPRIPFYEISRAVYRFGRFGDLLRIAHRIVWLSRFKFRRIFRSIAARWRGRPLGLGGLGAVFSVYINLDSRRDRKLQVLEEFTGIGMEDPHRFPALARTPGILGCTLSHAVVLEESKSDSRPIMGCEDDVEFLATRADIETVLGAFLRDPSLDVLCLAYNLGAQPHRLNPLLAITNDTQTASCYVVKDRAKAPLARIFFLGASRLEKGAPAWAAANDIMWKRLQRTSLAFAIPHKPMARQRASFSDIEGRYVDYGV
jgi:hypothetical protein